MFHPILLYSWRFSRCSAPIHWLVHGHMTSNNETVSRRMPERATLRKLWRQTGNSSLLPTQCWPLLSIKWSFVFHRFDPFVLPYNKSLYDWSLGEQWILFPENLNVSRDEVEGNIENLNVSLDFVSGNIEILGKQNSLCPSGPVIKCLMSYS